MPSAKLQDLEILVLDCQATRAYSAGGRLLEIGWMALRASSTNHEKLSNARISRIRPEHPFEIPPRVLEITGLTACDLSSGHTETEVWQKLSITARNIAAAQPVSHCPVAIHFASFETPYLRMLHKKSSPPSDFPLDIICTHVIARRLFPQLPRRGLRALAGYLGLSVAPERRCRHHLAATALIWRKMVPRLQEEHGVMTLEDLGQWLVSPPAPANQTRTYPMPREARSAITENPGIYRLCRADGEVLYVDKAASLRRRVNSYFTPRAKHSNHILEMLSQARQIDTTPTGSALEAALLETDEIKHLAPPYNIALQVRQRVLWFFSPDFQNIAHTYDRQHPVGPLTDKQSGVALATLAHLLTTPGILPCDDAIWEQLTGKSNKANPDERCRIEGIELFRQRYLSTLARGPLPRMLLVIGARLWRQSREVTPEVADSEHPLEDAADEMIWTPDAVVEALEKAVRYSTWQIRRARWLALLTQCTLAWAIADGGENKKRRVLMIQNGSVIDRDRLSPNTTPPPPIKTSRGAHGHLDCFDITVFDRIRVLSTELRRLICEGRFVQLRVGPRFILSNDDLKKAFYWI
jgi:DNA polymerase III subunit epsilon